MFDEYKTKVEIRGFATNGSLIIEDRNGIIFKRKPKHVSPLKKKDELEVGDKFKSKNKEFVEVIAKENDIVNTVNYFGKTNCNKISVWNEYDVDKIIYD